MQCCFSQVIGISAIRSPFQQEFNYIYMPRIAASLRNCFIHAPYLIHEIEYAVF